MARTSQTSRRDSQELQLLAERLKAWRATRQPRQRIPEELWNAAAHLAGVHGLSRTATALKLAYYDLRRRVTGASPPRRPTPQPAPFVPLAPPSWPVGPVEGGTLERVQIGGARLTLRLPNAKPQDLVPLVRLVLRYRR